MREALIGLVSLALAAAAQAQGPTLTHLYPAAGQQGTKTTVAIAGKATPWPPKVWVDAPGITFTPAAKAPNFEVEIAADAPPGPHFVRLYDDKGASAPRYFIVSREPELKDTEPNDRFTAPQKIEKLPATISGALNRSEDVDSYAVALKKGQTLVAWLESYVLGSALDGVLRVVNERGAQLAFNHDAATLDPFLTWTAPADGTYVVQVFGFAYPANSSVSLTSSENAVYRLHLTNGPYVHHTLPLQAPADKPDQVKLIGFNLAKDAAPPAGQSSDRAEELEREPHDPAQAIPLPGAVTGHITKNGEEDRYTFTAAKGKIYELKVTAFAQGSPLDAWVKIEAAGGKELVRSDDSGSSRDPQLTWTASADGPVTVAIGDVTHRGSPEHFYRIAINEAVPAVEGTVAAPSFTIAGGKTAEVKVQVKRVHKFARKLELTPKNLPEGVTAAAVPVPDKDGELTLKLTATAETAPANQPFQIALREIEGGAEHLVKNVLTTTAENNGVPSGYTTLVIPAISDLWITVTK